VDRLGPGLLTLGLIVILIGLVAWGWRNRLARQADIAPLPAIPAELPGVPRSFDGQYIVTTTAGDWLDRIAVHSLGVKANATVHVFADGVLIERTGSADVYIGRDKLDDVRLERGMAGKYVEKEGLVVLTWRLGETAVDTGFRTRRAADKRDLFNAITELLTDAADHADNKQDEERQ
jgi:hypothetical protein